MAQLVCLSTSATAGVMPLSLLLYLQSDFEVFRCAARITITPRNSAVVALSHGVEAVMYKQFFPKEKAKILREHNGKAVIDMTHNSEAR